MGLFVMGPFVMGPLVMGPYVSVSMGTTGRIKVLSVYEQGALAT